MVMPRDEWNDTLLDRFYYDDDYYPEEDPNFDPEEDDPPCCRDFHCPCGG